MNPDKVYPQMQQEDKVKKVAFQAIENVEKIEWILCYFECNTINQVTRLIAPVFF